MLTAPGEEAIPRRGSAALLRENLGQARKRYSRAQSRCEERVQPEPERVGVAIFVEHVAAELGFKSLLQDMLVEHEIVDFKGAKPKALESSRSLR